MTSFLGYYWTMTPGVCFAVDSTVRLDLLNEPQPDALLFIEPSLGGRVRIEDSYIVGGPDLAAEIANTSLSIDLGLKLQAYRRNGVREYVVWRVQDRTIDWFVFARRSIRSLAAAKWHLS